MIETRLLYYFLAVAREQSITRAAQALHVSQPTLSKQMMELEEQLGKQLLVRGRRRITLTEEGAFLRARAQEMIELLEKTESAFLTGTEPVAGDIWLGSGETPAMELLTEVFRKVQIEYPGVRLHIYSGDAQDVSEKLDKGLLDLGLLLGPVQEEKFDYMSLERSDAFGLLVPRGCELAARRSVSPQELYGLPLILSAQTALGRHRFDWVGLERESLNIVATYNLIYNATFMVEKGLGYALTLEGLVNTEGRDFEFVPFDPPLKIAIYLATKKYRTFSPAVKVFLERLREELSL